MAQQWVRFEHKGDVAIGTLEGETITMYSGVDILSNPKKTGVTVALKDVRLMAPLRPKSILALWNNFHERAKVEGQEIPDQPLYFMKPVSSVIGPGEVIYRPYGKEEVRTIFEAELAVVIGKECRDVSEAEAADYIFGYTCINDVTAPKVLYEYKSKVAFQQWSRSKGYDTFTPLGPAVVTGVDLHGLRVKAVLDGQTLQDYLVIDMVFSPAQVVSMISHVQTLEEGDVISLGTSVGAGPMNAEQCIEVVIPGVGTLKNTFQDRHMALSNASKVTMLDQPVTGFSPVAVRSNL